MGKVLLSVSHVSKSFLVSRTVLGKREFVHAVNDISFEVHEGETFSIVGESGCGKSTTARLIDRLIEPDNGKIVFDGLDLVSLDEKKLRSLRSSMQMIFQNPYGSLNPRMKVQNIVGEPLRVHKKMSKRERLESVRQLLEEVGLSASYGERYPHEFSGGQRQRIAIARALSVHPKLVIGDEPVSALDVSIQAQVLNLLQDLQHKYHLTYLIISHNLSVVEMISDRVAVMYLGEIVEMGPNEEIYGNPAHPYTQALLSSIPLPDPTRKRESVVLHGDLPSPRHLPAGCPFHTRCPMATELCRRVKPAQLNLGEGHMVKCHYPQNHPISG